MKLFIYSLLLSLSSVSIFACKLHNSTIFTPKLTASVDRIISLPGFGCVHDLELAGFLPITPIKSKISQNPGLFYWFVESRDHSKDAPIVLWLNGGPGAASTYGFFMENGAYTVTAPNVLTARKFAWSSVANYLIIDQPAGVGLSYGERGVYANESQAIDQLYEAILVFFKRYPELSERSFFIAGQSYAGKYIPQLVMRILNDKNHRLKLKGILIGDGFVNPLLQQSSDADYAYAHGMIDKNTYTKVTQLSQQCAAEINKSTPSSAHANDVCNKIRTLLVKQSGNLNINNIQTSKEAGTSMMDAYLNQTAVRKALHVDARVGVFKGSNKITEKIFSVGEWNSVATLYEIILNKGIEVLVYNGLDDASDSNFMGTDKWLEALNWHARESFVSAPTCAWYLNKEVAGYVRNTNNLTQIKLRKAGHIAPADQPEVLLNLFANFIKNHTFCR